MKKATFWKYWKLLKLFQFLGAMNQSREFHLQIIKESVTIATFFEFFEMDSKFINTTL